MLHSILENGKRMLRDGSSTAILVYLNVDDILHDLPHADLAHLKSRKDHVFLCGFC
jgi:hypothetical protein